MQGAAPSPDADLRSQREVVDAFLAAARRGDFEKLIAVLHPNVVLRSDHGARASRIVRGAHRVAARAQLFAQRAGSVQPVLVNGAAGVLSWLPDGQPLSVIGFTVTGGKIVEIDVFRDPERLRRLSLFVNE